MIGRFVLEARAASGGMGVVYKARDTQSGAHVAIKLLHRRDHTSQARFAREASILAELDHPAIVRYVAHGHTDDGAPYLAMEWVDGETLNARLERRSLSVDESVGAIRRIAEALGHAHARGVVHRDIKPSNLMLPQRDVSRIAVLDFGIARGNAQAGGLTATGTTLGTPSYMAPEQARGVREIDGRADVFALGCVLYECATGRRAFEGKHMLALLAKVALWEPPSVRSLDPALSQELDDVIVRMLAKDRDQRPADGNAVAELLATMPSDSRAPRGHSAVGTAQTAVSTPGAHERLASLVISADPRSADGDTVISRDVEDLRASAAIVDGVRIETMHDGSFVAIVDGVDTPPPELARRALECARALRRVAPTDVIAIATGPVGHEGELAQLAVAALVDPTVAALAREAMAGLFGGATNRPPAGAIRVDERTAGLLGGSATRVGNAWYAERE